MASYVCLLEKKNPNISIIFCFAILETGRTHHRQLRKFVKFIKIMPEPLTYIYTWPLNPSVRIIDLVSHTTYVVCVNLIHKWRDLQFKVNSEWQIFWESFHGNFYLLSEEFLPEICWEEIAEENTFRIYEQAKLAHLGRRKPARIHWKTYAPKTSHCLVRILFQRHNWVILLWKWARRGRYSQ